MKIRISTVVFVLVTTQVVFGQPIEGGIKISDAFGKEYVDSVFYEVIKEHDGIITKRLSKLILNTFYNVRLSEIEQGVDYAVEIRDGMILVLDKMNPSYQHGGFAKAIHYPNRDIKKKEYKYILSQMRLSCGEAGCKDCCTRCSPCPN